VVGKAPPRRLTKAVAALTLALAGVSPALGEDLCAQLTVPSQLRLGCATTTVPGEVEVTPSGGAFAALSRMTVRALDRAGPDAGAWSDPSAWLRGQMTPDTSRLADVLGGLASDPDSPFAGEDATAALESLKRALAGVSALALSACDEPAPLGPERWEMRCNYTTDGLGMLVALRLVGAGDRRWAVTMRAANEQRLRHFEAIANSFQPS
jgi:hypothetical protein